MATTTTTKPTSAAMAAVAPASKRAPRPAAAAAAPEDEDDDEDTPTSADEANGRAGGQTDEDIWPEDVEQSFQEALAIYPPIGRRKLLDNGKMYGRNELIARYIYARTRKLRTRKQVSSHIQVLGKKNRKVTDAHHQQAVRTAMLHHVQQAQLQSARKSGSEGSEPAAERSPSQQVGTTQPMYYTVKQEAPSSSQYLSLVMPPGAAQQASTSGFHFQAVPTPSAVVPTSMRHVVNLAALAIPQAPPRVFMRHFYAYMEHENPAMTGVVSRHLYVHFATEKPNATFNENDLERVDIRQILPKFSAMVDLWNMGSSSAFYLVKFFANLNSGPSYGLHALTSKYESKDRLKLRCSTIVSSFGKPVVEKIQVEDAILENNCFVYYFNQSPMCDYMVHFLEKLKALDSPEKMDKVLENFSVLQVITDFTTGYMYLCTAFLFSTSPSGFGSHQIYKLVQESS